MFGLFNSKQNKLQGMSCRGIRVLGLLKLCAAFLPNKSHGKKALQKFASILGHATCRECGTTGPPCWPQAPHTDAPPQTQCGGLPVPTTYPCTWMFGFSYNCSTMLSFLSEHRRFGGSCHPVCCTFTLFPTSRTSNYHSHVLWSVGKAGEAAAIGSHALVLTVPADLTRNFYHPDAAST